ncbi:hypothetical protein GLOTRDRAFT_49138 [Gloeophyllum trabeum ATCC 11539]|uniref:Uncharacterized protein n=1 Tax=Gloeophyllum trabeum (strain ATCC 11539 / FP-39264 / Madison 617) TaxID=670483 RepID=S7PUW4_GLOTA|nr:uncharacterized protein GLOTRDRAFT_49138 [Gloeophyllum trabeum ATCC 11539]EPQ51218.1 hypothetical protein GLOTRDRAFT_49138 [Gloeophyllum trabeum ATCC 11539]
MSNLINKLTGKGSGSGNSQPSNEPTYSIQPHPAQTNDPRDLEPPQLGGGLNSKPEYQAFHARDPHVPSKEIRDNMPQPASREELKARSAQLNNRSN